MQLSEENSQTPLTMRHLCFLLMHELWSLLPKINLREQTLLPYGLCTYSRTSLFSTSHLFIYSQCKFFLNNFYLPLPYLMYKTACHSHVAFSIWPCCWCFRLYGPLPSPFLVRIWLNKPFLLEKR